MVKFSLSNIISDSNIQESKSSQVGMYNRSERLAGSQIGLLNTSTHLSGSQLGLVNNARSVKGSQFGLLNNSDSVEGSQLGILNHVQELEGSKKSFLGFLTGAANSLQAGLVNIVDRDFEGLQLGLICYAKRGNYIQLGLLNVQSDYLGNKTFFPFFNYNFSGTSTTNKKYSCSNRNYRDHTSIRYGCDGK